MCLNSMPVFMEVVYISLPDSLNFSQFVARARAAHPWMSPSYALRLTQRPGAIRRGVEHVRAPHAVRSSGVRYHTFLRCTRVEGTGDRLATLGIYASRGATLIGNGALG